MEQGQLGMILRYKLQFDVADLDSIAYCKSCWHFDPASIDPRAVG